MQSGWRLRRVTPSLPSFFPLSWRVVFSFSLLISSASSPPSHLIFFVSLGCYLCLSLLFSFSLILPSEFLPFLLVCCLFVFF